MMTMLMGQGKVSSLRATLKGGKRPERSNLRSIDRFVASLLAMTLSLGVFGFQAFASDFRYEAKAKRDPFLSPAEATLLKKQLGPGELHLEGIIIDREAASYAVVNREVVKAGETFSGFLLKKIEPNAVTFEKDGEVFVLYLREDEKKSAGQNVHPLSPKEE